MKEQRVRRKSILTMFIASYVLLLGSASIFAANSPAIDWVLLSGFFALLYIVHMMPINYRNVTFSASFGVQFAIFLEFGFMIEAFVYQGIILLVLVTKKETNPFSYMANMAKAAITSIFAGYAYLIAGGAIQNEDLGIALFLPLMSYVLTYTVISYCTYIVVVKLLYRRRIALWDKTFAFTFGINAVGTVVGLIITSFIMATGTVSLYYMAVPFIALVFIMKIYNEIIHTNERLTNLNKMSTDFAAELNVSKTIETIMNSVEGLISYDYCYLFTFDSDKNVLVPQDIRSFGDLDHKAIEQFKDITVQLGDGLSGAVAESKHLIRINHADQKTRYKNEPDFLHHIQSYISVPMMWNHELIGVITLAHGTKNAYNKTDETVMEILASHAAVAIQNAIQFEKTQSEGRTDQLTGLCNYHYFEHQLYTIFNRIKDRDIPLTLILLDIDHFKSVNDRYGHLAGNQLLIQLAEKMHTIIAGKGIVARYGGEEFTVLLENVALKDAHAIAELIRGEIEQHVFTIEDGLENNNYIEIHLTVSIGLATYPDQADDPLSLIRHADRAMYIGAKKAGRNRVASYEAG